MGKTKKDVIRAKYKRLNKKDTQEFNLFVDKMRNRNPDRDVMYIWTLSKMWHSSPWDKLTEHEKLVIVNYSRNPSWHNLLYNRVPKRRQDRDMLKKIDINDDNDYVFTLNNKPNAYYW